MKKPRPILNLKRRVVKIRRNNTKKSSDEEILKYRQMMNDENYLNNAIGEIADRFTKSLEGVSDA